MPVCCIFCLLYTKTRHCNTRVNLFLVADCEGGCTDYTLELHFQAEIFSQTCADATTTPLTTGGHSLSGNLENGTNESDMGNLWCTGNDANGGEVWVPVDLAPGERVDLLDYTQLLDDSSAYVVSNCADPTGTCLIGADDNGAAQSESLSYANAGGVTERVFLVLDCFGVIGNCREYQAHIAVQ